MTTHDRDLLRLLSILHLLFAGLGLAGLVALGIAFVAGMPGWLYGLLALLCLAGIVFNAVAAYWLRVRRHRAFCMVVAALDLALVPFGTLLGVFGLVMLSRERVRRGFGDAG